MQRKNKKTFGICSRTISHPYASDCFYAFIRRCTLHIDAIQHEAFEFGSGPSGEAQVKT